MTRPDDALVEALKPFVAFADKIEARYRERGGNPDSFPDSHPFATIEAHELPCGVWRKARAAIAAVEAHRKEQAK